MTKDVIVSIKGTQYDETGTANPMEVITAGTYYYKNDRHYVLYDEPDEDSGKVTKNTLKFAQSEASLKKSGVSNVQMIFDKENKTLSTYVTPFGGLTIGIDTKKISCNESEDKIRLDIDYALDVNYEFLADCRMKIEIAPIGSPVNLTN